ncbi:hypothetical protein [Mycobacterium intracellulare]|uniref:hypothetical protein n=1 Tax=Mycobacterium intracellulare TaxID=1767 RepID=UPI0034D36708
MGVDLLREHLGSLAIQSSRQRFTRNVTPHPCIVAARRFARKEARLLAPERNGGELNGRRNRPLVVRIAAHPRDSEEVFVFLPEGPRR